MNQKDYKAIAEIIKHCKDEHNLIPYKTYVNHLVDYFKREAKETDTEYIDKNLGNNIHKGELKFNKKQFLKDCGVKE